MADGQTIKPPYRVEDGVTLIELRLANARELFNLLDPAPLREKDLAGDVEEYIVGATNELPLRAPLKLIFHLPSDQTATPGARAIDAAVPHYFDYRCSAEERRLRAMLREARVSLAIGLAFLFACLVGRQVLVAYGTGTFEAFVEEGLLIIGWVAMWRPIDNFLFGWWPIRRRCRVYRKLAATPVEIRTAAA